MQKTLNYENLISKSIFCLFDILTFDVRIESQKQAGIQNFRDKEIPMSTVKNTAARKKAPKGVTDEE
jgi:hypothetical protein